VPNQFSERKDDFFQTWAQSTSSALKVVPLQECHIDKKKCHVSFVCPQEVWAKV
jgi:hypothetical protein